MKFTVTVGLAYSSCRKETDRFPVFKLAERLTDTIYRNLTLVWIITGKSVDCNKIRTHGCDLIQNHVHHNLVFRASRRDKINKRDTIESTKRMIANGNKCSLRQIIELLLIINTQLDFEPVQK